MRKLGSQSGSSTNVRPLALRLHGRRLSLGFAASLALIGSASAQTDLISVYQDALQQDAVYTAARYQFAATETKRDQGLSGLLPQVVFSGSVTRTQNETSGSQNFTRYYTPQTYALQLTQPLFRWANLEAFEQSKLQVQVGQAQLAQAKIDLMLRVSQAYFDVLAAQDALTTIRAQKTAITEQLAFAKRNFEVGTATITDQQEAQARFDLTTAQEFALTNDLNVKRSALSQIVGRPVGDRFKTLRSDVTLQAPSPADAEAWLAQTRDSNYQVAAQRIALEIARREIARNRAAHYPTVDLSAQYARAQDATVAFLGLRSNTSQIGINVAIPIYAGGGIDAKVREASSLRDKAEADLNNAQRTVEQGSQQAYSGVYSGLAQVQALKAAEQSSQLALKSNRLGYEVGVRINIDVLNAQQQLYTTQRDLAKARYDTLIAGLRLKALAGSLSENDLSEINNLLTNPATN